MEPSESVTALANRQVAGWRAARRVGTKVP